VSSDQPRLVLLGMILVVERRVLLVRKIKHNKQVLLVVTES
jgi:hypothetical protein